MNLSISFKVLLVAVLSPVFIANGQQYFNGKVSQIEIFCFLQKGECDSISGRLFYAKHRKEIFLKGIGKKNEIKLWEYDNGKVTGIYSGSINGEDSISGQWSDPSGNKVYPFFLFATSQKKYNDVLESKDYTSIQNENLKLFVKGFKEKSLPFKFDNGDSENFISEKWVRAFINPDFGKENFDKFYSYYKGYVWYSPIFINLIVFESYEPGAFGVHNVTVFYYTFSYNGKLIDSKELGCYCYDGNMGLNDYYASSIDVSILDNEVKVKSSQIHETLIENPEAIEERDTEHEEKIENFSYIINENGIITLEN